MAISFGSLFTGFGGADIGAITAGMTPAWGIEYDPEIAAVANANLGDHVTVANLLRCSPSDFAPVDVLHASPPCPNFSVAKIGGKEDALDFMLAGKVAQFISVLQPRIFTLENVWAYRNSQSWAGIRNAIERAGYWYDVAHVNAADFGVPQTRQRMIVRALRGSMVPPLPPAEPWVGWYDAIADLVDDLPETTFAKWQLARLPAELRTMLVSNAKTEYSDGVRERDEPALCATPQQSGRLRAFIMGKNNNKYGDGTRRSSEQAQTIGANEHGSKAFVAGRTVAITPRCLSRFQSFPDRYELPRRKTLAARGIGNAVPPLLMEKIYKQLLLCTDLPERGNP